MKAVIVPYQDLSPEALNGVIEEFVTRDGTDYGISEVSLEVKVSQVKKQLKDNKAVIVFEHDTQTCNILSSTDPALKSL